LLQAAARLARSGKRVLYISGEEAVDQVRLRARRLGLQGDPLELAASINLRDIAASISETKDAALVVIDSIQTMWMEGVESAPGSVSQVRASAFELIRIAKQQTAALVLVGHVTREGTIAGPRVLEHMVDAVLHFEGDRGHQFRILRGVKNRFGATDEIGVFEMGEEGLTEVANPSALFLAERRGNVSGSAVFAGMEGTRPVLVEVQCLLSANAGGSPRRSVIGWDSGRLSMLLAVLETRCGLKMGATDVYLNIAGGLGERAGGRSGRGRRPGQCGDRPADRPGQRVFRGGRAFRRGAAGGAGGGAVEGGAEAWVQSCRAAAAGGGRQPQAVGAGGHRAGRDRPSGRPGGPLHPETGQAAGMTPA
jgi:DNA repair protein RadA/Sms